VTAVPLRRQVLRSLAVGLMPAAVAVHAQTVAEPPKASASAPQASGTLQKVEVVGGAVEDNARRDDTATKIVVTQEEMTRYGDTTLADVLKRQPGITVSGGNAGRGGGEIRMRGLGAGYTQILLNGERAPPGFTLDSLPPSQVERIEILRAATAEFSTQAIAGTINIVLKNKVTAAQRSLKLTVEGANVFAASALDLQLADKLDRLSYTLSGNLRVGRFKHESLRQEDGTDAQGQPNALRTSVRQDEGRFTVLSLTPRINWTLSDGDTLSWQSFVLLNRSHSEGVQRWTTVSGEPPAYLSNQTQPTDRFDLFRTDVNRVRKFEDGSKLDAKLGFNASRRETDFRQQGYDAADAQTLDAVTTSSATDHGFTSVGKFSTPLGADHTLGLGWDAGLSHRRENRVEHNRPIPGYEAVDSDERYTATLSRLALYAQDEWAVTPKLSLYLGLRAETLKTDSEGNTFSAIQHRSTVVSPLLQLLWKLPESKQDQVRLALTRTYKAPGIQRLIPRRYTSIYNSPISPDNQGNPDLKPELATGLDLAFEHYFGGGALFSVAAYLRQIDGFTRGDVRLVGDRWIAMPVNDGRARTHGLELDAKFPLQLLNKQAPAIDLRASIARNWSSVDQVPGPHNRLADQTPLSANVGFDYRWSAVFNVGGNFAYKAGGPIRLSENSSTYSSIKREMDLYGLWKLDAQRQLRLSAVNVLAQPYTSVSQYSDASGSQRATSVFPFSVSLRLVYEMKL
jgi:outer membrane receptor for ferrienterochelin and colicins